MTRRITGALAQENQDIVGVAQSADWGNLTNTPVQYFHEKLRRLDSAMNTEPRRRRAQKRISQMREFIEVFKQDWKAGKSF